MLLVWYIATLLTVCSRWQIDAKSVVTSPGKVALKASIYWSSSGLDFVPRPDPADAENTLIYYKAGDEASVRKWTSKIDEFFKQYNERGPGSENVMACTPELQAAGDRFCEVSLRDFEPCTSENKYSYHRASPCVFLKLDKLLNWTPNPYNTTEDLPTDMPDALKQHINNVAGTKEANTVWVSCEGENPADVEFMGPTHFLPRRGFPGFYFPYTNQRGYLSPLVAVHFERPTTGILINITCKAWAKNIIRDQYERRGAVHFELMVDA